MVGNRSLIQATVERLTPIIPPERIWVLTNDDLRDTIVNQLPEVPKSQILAEPMQRNTAPAIGLAAQILHNLDPDAVMGVFPADHVIGKLPPYRAVLKAALRAAAGGELVVVGVEPCWPETGYGYIEFPRGCAKGESTTLPVRKFHEKPDLAKARKYLKSGNYFWNSGMFFWRTDVLLEQLRLHLPRTATLLASLPQVGARSFKSQLNKAFPLCDSISIDYAVLEKAHNVRGLAARDFGWNDVGSWNAVYELLERDSLGNSNSLDSIAIDSHNNFVDARGKLVALLGVRDLIVVDTPDALLVAHRDQAQKVGEVVKTLEKHNRHELL